MIKEQFSLAELAELTDTELVGNPDLKIVNVDDLKSASEQDASFFSNSSYRELMKHSNAGVICIDRQTDLIEGKNFLLSDDPSRTFQLIAEKILGFSKNNSGFKGIHPSAVIHESVKLGINVTIGPLVVIDADTTIGDCTHIYPSVSIASGVTVGADCTLYPGSVVRERCILQDRVVLQPGAVIGSCGFGFTSNTKTGQHTTLEQIGTVILEDDVEVGANSTIDRARFKNTLIKKGTKIDNLVQIAHNVELGENNIIVSQTGISGSTTLGNNVVLGGQVGVVGHISICDNVKIAARGGVTKSVKNAGIYGGDPTLPISRFNKHRALLRRIETYAKEIKSLKKRLDTLEN